MIKKYAGIGPVRKWIDLKKRSKNIAENLTFFTSKVLVLAMKAYDYFSLEVLLKVNDLDNSTFCVGEIEFTVPIRFS